MKTAIVTGASGGIGQAVAETLLERGWHVGLLARRKDKLQAIADRHPNTTVLTCDVTDELQVAEAFQSYAAAQPRLDLLFNNAGIFTPAAPVDEVPVADWVAAVSVNLTGMFLCARAAFGLMRHQSPQGGRIINNGSVSAHTPREGSITYTATKHGVTGLTKTLALDGRPFDINAGQIDIGNARTEMVEALIERETAAGRPAPPSFDVRLAADAVVRMAELPPEANTLFQTIMAPKMPYVGRG